MKAMKARSIVEAVQKESGFTQKMIATGAGMKNQTNVSEALKRDMKISVFCRFINAMGYEIIVRKKRPGNQGEGYKVIDGIDPPKDSEKK